MNIKYFLKLIRIHNLLIAGGLMAMIKFCVIDPMLALFNLTATFTWLDEAFLIASVMFVAAGGYVINDYFDTKSDVVNRPNERIVGCEISRGSAASMHIVLSVMGCIFGMLASLRIGFWQLGLLYPFVVGLLWFYSSAYKGMFLVGNIVVALLTAIVPILPSLYEMRGLLQIDDPCISMGVFDPIVILYWSVGYGVFAFGTTLVREIIKDAEDVEGDIIQECRTLPIVLGTVWVKIIVSILILCIVAALSVAYVNFLNEIKTAIYIGVAVLLPFLFLLFRVLTAKNKNDWHFCSIVTKIVMVFGILYLILVRYNFVIFKTEF